MNKFKIRNVIHHSPERGKMDGILYLEDFCHIRQADKYKRQDEFLRRFDECLSKSEHYRTVNHLEPGKAHPTNLLIDYNVLIEFLHKKQIYKKFFISLYDFKNHTQDKLYSILSKIIDHTKSLDMLGFEVMDRIRIHASRDWKRTFHCLYLAHAIICSCTLLNVRVSHSTYVSQKKHIYFRKRTAYPELSLFNHLLRVFPKGVDEKVFIKTIKNSLCRQFSIIASQEIPELNGLEFNLFPLSMQNFIDKYVKNDREKSLRFYFSILQSKALCAPVGDDMIEESYLKHEKSICRPREEVLEVPQEILDGLYKFGKEFGRKMIEKGHYEPFKTSIPPSSACFEKSRSKGGVRQFCKENFLTISDGTYKSLDSRVRFEPFVIGLFGPPGSGKTTLVNKITSYLGKKFFPTMLDSDLAYSRSCHLEHWDGYKNQPIVILDDFGQDLTIRNDIIEFEQLVSTNRYPLPMAELKEKGTLFTSPFILLTSNTRFGSNFMQTKFTKFAEDPYAIWRRIKIPLLVNHGVIWKIIPKYPGNDASKLQAKIKSNFQNDYTYLRKMFEDPKNLIRTIEDRHNPYYHQLATQQSEGCNGRMEPLSYELDLFTHFSLRDVGLPEELCKLIYTSAESSLTYHNEVILEKWRQIVSSQKISYLIEKDLDYCQVSCNGSIFHQNKAVSAFLDFPINPPDRYPQVTAIALSEPLKVRMITKGDGVCSVLKPLQKGLWNTLQEYSYFKLTGGCKNICNPTGDSLLDLEKEIKRITHSNGIYLSGDYTAATDNLPMSVTNALLEGILSEVDHRPTELWARWETGPHMVHYPKGVCKLQTSGQLMGSLLSFPLLCLANAYICKFSGIKEEEMLINGDDIVACTNELAINAWKENAPKMGLSLSLGKNFVDTDFCTVNSQLFFKSNLLNSGKVKLISRKDRPLAETYYEAQKRFGQSNLLEQTYIRFNILRLRDTPCSLQVPVTHGGLALSWGHPKSYDDGHQKKVYFCKLFQSFFKKDSFIKSLLGIEAMAVPYISEEDLSSFSYNKVNLEEDINRDSFNRIKSLDFSDKVLKNIDEFSNKEFHQFYKGLILRHPPIDVLVKTNRLKLMDFPPLSSFQSRIIYIRPDSETMMRDTLSKAFTQHLFTLLMSKIDDKYESIPTKVDFDYFITNEKLRALDVPKVSSEILELVNKYLVEAIKSQQNVTTNELGTTLGWLFGDRKVSSDEDILQTFYKKYDILPQPPTVTEFDSGETTSFNENEMDQQLELTEEEFLNSWNAIFTAFPE